MAWTIKPLYDFAKGCNFLPSTRVNSNEWEMVQIFTIATPRNSNE